MGYDGCPVGWAPLLNGVIEEPSEAAELLGQGGAST